MLNITLGFFIRQKREDDCMDCLGREWSTAKSIVERWKVGACEGKNIVVCKSCTSNDLRGTAIDTWERAYNVLCFDTGTITNTVRCLDHFDCFSLLRSFGSTSRRSAMIGSNGLI